MEVNDYVPPYVWISGGREHRRPIKVPTIPLWARLPVPNWRWEEDLVVRDPAVAAAWERKVARGLRPRKPTGTPPSQGP